MTPRLITLTVADGLYALDIDCVREAVTGRSLLSVPMAPPPLAGLLLMRGDVITAIDLRVCLGLDSRRAETVDAVVIEQRSLSMAVVVDAIGDVIDVPAEGLLAAPDTLAEHVSRIARGACMLSGRPVLVLDHAELFASAMSSPKELVR